MERQVDILQKEKEAAHASLTRDHEETIKCLQEHVKKLERCNFQKELESVNVSTVNVSQAMASQDQASQNRPPNPYGTSYIQTSQTVTMQSQTQPD